MTRGVRNSSWSAKANWNVKSAGYRSSSLRRYLRWQKRWGLPRAARAGSSPKNTLTSASRATKSPIGRILRMGNCPNAWLVTLKERIKRRDVSTATSSLTCTFKRVVRGSVPNVQVAMDVKQWQTSWCCRACSVTTHHRRSTSLSKRARCAVQSARVFALYSHRSSPTSALPVSSLLRKAWRHTLIFPDAMTVSEFSLR